MKLSFQHGPFVVGTRSNLRSYTSQLWQKVLFCLFISFDAEDGGSTGRKKIQKHTNSWWVELNMKKQTACFCSMFFCCENSCHFFAPKNIPHDSCWASTALSVAPQFDCLREPKTRIWQGSKIPMTHPARTKVWFIYLRNYQAWWIFMVIITIKINESVLVNIPIPYMDPKNAYVHQGKSRCHLD